MKDFMDKSNLNNNNKTLDVLLILFLPLLFAPFIISKKLLNIFIYCSNEYPYTLSFIKFAILATFGEIVSYRISRKSYPDKSFGILPKMVVWGILGMAIKASFVIFGSGSVALLNSIIPSIKPTVLSTKGFSYLKLFASFFVSLTMNLVFAPVMMTCHKMLDIIIIESNGTFRGFFKKNSFGNLLSKVNWEEYGGFVLAKTIPFFWIPAHTITFLLPASFQVLFAALLSIMLGIFLAYKPKSKNKI